MQTVPTPNLDAAARTQTVATVYAASVLTQAVPTPKPTATPSPSSTPVPTPVTRQNFQGFLPAPVYSLAKFSGTDQIWRLNLDGSMTQITHEAAGVWDLDVSSTDGTIAYVVAENDPQNGYQAGKRLILIDQDGGNPRVLIDGLTVKQPLWSPDGKKLAYWLGGLKTVDFESGIWTDVLTDPNRQPPQNVHYYPWLWSPNGQTLVVRVQYYEGNDFALYTAQGEPVIEDLEVSCGEFAYSPDGLALFFGVETVHEAYCDDNSALWRFSTQKDAKQLILNGQMGNDQFKLAAWPIVTQNGRVNFFYGEISYGETESQDSPTYHLVSTNLQGRDLRTLRAESYPCCFREVLWTKDGSLAFVRPSDGNSLILQANDGPAVSLEPIGFNLHWGLPYQEIPNTPWPTVTPTPAPTPLPVPVSVPGQPGAELAFDDSQIGLVLAGQDGASLLKPLSPLEHSGPIEKITWAPDRASVLFLQDGRIYRAWRGSQALEITTPIGLPEIDVQYVNFALSPDGRFLAVIYLPTGPGPTNLPEERFGLQTVGLLDLKAQLWLDLPFTDLNTTDYGSPSRQEIHLSEFAWSVDSQRFIFLVERDGNTNMHSALNRPQLISATLGGSAYFMDLFVVNTSGKMIKILDSSLYYSYLNPLVAPRWVPGRDQILFEGYGDDILGQLYQITSTGGEPKPLARVDQVHLGGSDLPVQSYRLSPDHQKIFFSLQDGRSVVTNLDGSKPVLFEQTAKTRAFWSPNGKQAVFDCLLEGSDDLCLVKAAGGGFVRLTNNAFAETWASWSPDGQTLAVPCPSSAGVTQICTVKPDGSGLFEIPGTENLGEIAPVWSPP